MRNLRPAQGARKEQQEHFESALALRRAVRSWARQRCRDIFVSPHGLGATRRNLQWLKAQKRSLNHAPTYQRAHQVTSRLAEAAENFIAAANAHRGHSAIPRGVAQSVEGWLTFLKGHANWLESMARPRRGKPGWSERTYFVHEVGQPRRQQGGGWRLAGPLFDDGKRGLDDLVALAVVAGFLTLEDCSNAITAKGYATLKDGIQVERTRIRDAVERLTDSKGK